MKQIPDPNGFTLRHRKRWQGTYHLDPLLWVMMDWFIDHAQWENKTVKIPGKRAIKLKRGQVIFTERQLANFFKVGRQQIRSHLTSMKNNEFLTRDTTQHISVATVLNYDRYQQQASTNNPQTNHKPTQTPTHVPFKEIKEYKEKGHGQKMALEQQEKEQIAAAASHRVAQTTKYLEEKSKLTPALNISATDLKKQLKNRAQKQAVKNYGEQGKVT